jgi:hypothetical protein
MNSSPTKINKLKDTDYVVYNDIFAYNASRDLKFPRASKDNPVVLIDGYNIFMVIERKGRQIRLCENIMDGCRDGYVYKTKKPIVFYTPQDDIVDTEYRYYISQEPDINSFSDEIRHYELTMKEAELIMEKINAHYKSKFEIIEE